MIFVGIDKIFIFFYDNKYMRRILEFLQKNWIRMSVSFFAGAIILIGYVALQSRTVSATTGEASYPWDKLINYVNGAFISGVLISLVSILILLSSYGTFNIFTFYMKRKKKENGYKESYYEYNERVEESQSSYRFIFLPYLIIGLVYIVTALIIYFVAIGK